ncbi:hypothetical protein K1719_012342 [Acacia pycnantha]|nr:hypothetical protein K1719_012342 [Acacia pycnantha]
MLSNHITFQWNFFQDRALLNAIGNLELTGLNAEALSKLGHKLEDVACQDIRCEIHSSLVDKAHLSLASAKAVLRLSRQWDHKIPIGLFYLTLETSKINFPEAKKIFLSKVHQYIKDRLLDAKYSCALMLNIFESKADEFAEGKQYLVDIIQMLQQTKAREQSDVNSAVTYPEYILPYLVHALAHNSCPNIDECKEVETYDNIYRQLHLILSILLHRDEDTTFVAFAV